MRIEASSCSPRALPFDSCLSILRSEVGHTFIMQIIFFFPLGENWGQDSGFGSGAFTQVQFLPMYEGHHAETL